MSQKATPVIVRKEQKKDREAKVIYTPHNSVSFTRGLGDSGNKIEVVEYTCPCCGYDRLTRLTHINPEAPANVKYHCNRMTCPHYVGETYRYAQTTRASTPKIRMDKPETWNDA